MKQVLLSLKTGAVEVVEAPRPPVRRGCLLVRATRSLISTGTERMLVGFGRAGWIEKARQQPEKVRQVWGKLRTDGLLATVDAVLSRLDEPLPLGYAHVGVVVAVGEGVAGFSPGDRVVSNGPHAEWVVVPGTLCARVPDGVPDDAAAFVVLGAVALQGVRLAQPTLGECFVVSGLGLVGLMAVQILLAHGCRVLGVDPDPRKAELARAFGAETVALDKGEDPVAAALAFSRGRGVDGVLLTLATDRSEPVREAAQMCRKRGRIVLVGVTGLHLNRADFYEKELSFQVSCSYGPGRYDPDYEERGHDYPIGFVRWTAQRNFEAVLDLMAAGKVRTEPLITHRFPIREAPRAYELLTSGNDHAVGILLEYPETDEGHGQTVALRAPAATGSAARPAVTLGVIGAGDYAGRILIPAFHRAGAGLHTIANTGNVKSVHYGRRFGFARATTDVRAVLDDPEIDAVVIATRHDSHARLVREALLAGKHVFCEKPLALTHAELEGVREAWEAAGAREGRILTVGFNRRFSPLVARMRALLDGVREPKAFIVTVNAGAVPRDHWTQDPDVGGGRILGEACHFVDLLRYLASSPIRGWTVETLGAKDATLPATDQATITLTFADGSMGSIHYLANGHRAFPKERIEVFCAGRVLQLDNFRVLRGFGWPGFHRQRLWRQDKGQRNCARAFVEAVRRGGPPPIPVAELFEVSRVTLEVAGRGRG